MQEALTLFYSECDLAAVDEAKEYLATAGGAHSWRSWSKKVNHAMVIVDISIFIVVYLQGGAPMWCLLVYNRIIINYRYNPLINASEIGLICTNLAFTNWGTTLCGFMNQQTFGSD